MRKRFKKIVAVLAVFALMIGISACQGGGDNGLRALDGSEVSLADFKGKPVLLHFWSASTPPCRAQLADIEELYQAAKKSDLEIVAVNMGESTGDVKKFIDKKGYHFRVILDSDKEFSKSYNVSSAPATYFINRDSKIVSSKSGVLNNQELYQNLKEIVNLGKKPGSNAYFDYFRCVIRVTAYGFAPKDINGASAKLMARRAAIDVAQRDLLNAVQNFALQQKNNAVDSISKIQVVGTLNNFQVVSENYLGQKGVFEVVIEAPLYGDSESSAASIFAQLIGDESSAKEPGDGTVNLEQNFTGVIVDARGLCIRPYINPKIIDQQGNTVYTIASADLSEAAESGLVGYAKDMSEAKQQARLGSNPLVIKAVDRSDELTGSVVISGDDAQKLGAINKRNNIFKKCAVVFIVD